MLNLLEELMALPDEETIPLAELEIIEKIKSVKIVADIAALDLDEEKCEEIFQKIDSYQTSIVDFTQLGDSLYSLSSIPSSVSDYI